MEVDAAIYGNGLLGELALVHKRWIVDHATVRKARVEDLRYVDDSEYIGYFGIYFANIITKLGKKLVLRQRVIATATVFFRRFYLKNSYCETDPFIVIAACCYVAAKAEESPVHIRTVISEAGQLFKDYGVKNFPTDNSKLAEMEFYLVDDLECDLVVFHPYRTLFALCKKGVGDGTTPAEHEEAEAGEVGVGISEDDGPRYWGSGEGRLELSTGALQMAWFIINDTYRSDLCLLYPPHMIAIAAIYLTLILHTATRATVTPLLTATPESTPKAVSEEPTVKPRRSSRNSTSSTESKKPLPPQDAITFLSELNVSLPLIATISQEIISLYTLWERYKEDANPEARLGHSPQASPSKNLIARSGSMNGAGTPSEPKDDGDSSTAFARDTGNYVTPTFLSGLLLKMRERKLMDVSTSGNRPVAVNKVLERMQAAG